MTENAIPKILVVDDEPWNLELMEAYLSGEYDITMAANGAEALEKVEQVMPDLILLDVLMPRMDGYQVCENLKKNESTHFIPVVLVTALSEKEDRIRGIEVGADEFLTKPVDMIELKTRVKSLLRIKFQQDMIRSERDTAQKYLDVAGVMMVIIDNEDRISLVNKKGTEILGYPESELIGRNWFEDFVPDSEKVIAKKAFTESVTEGEIQKDGLFEATILSKNKEEKTLSWHTIILVDENGNKTGVLCSGEDITPIKKAEQELKRTNEYLDLLIKTSPIATLSLDDQQNIITANKSAICLLKYNNEELIGKAISDLTEEGNLLDFANNKDYTLNFIRKDGICVPLNVSTSVMIESETSKGLIVTLQDISELRGLFISPTLEEPREVSNETESSADDLEAGYTYVIDGNDFMAGYEIFANMVKNGMPGLCITRNNPEKIRNYYGLTKTPFVWLTKNKKSDQPTIDPNELFKLHPTITNFIERAENGIVLIDGLEYLILENDFKSVIKFTEQTNDTIMSSEFRLMLQVDPGVFDSRDYHLLKRWMRSLSDE